MLHFRNWLNGFVFGVVFAEAAVPSSSFGFIKQHLRLQVRVAGVLAIRLVDVHGLGAR